MARHHLAATPDTVRWGYWDATVKPVMWVASGDTVDIDSLSGEPDDLPAHMEVLPEHREVLARTERGPGPHLLTGPVHVDGAEPGDVLEVRILDVRLRSDWGWNLIEPGYGALPEEFTERRRLHIPLDRTKNVAHLPWGTELPLDPFFGNFGVAPPPSYGRVNSIVPREFGGNMDCRALTKGTTVFFPIFNKGALFSAGDGHAVQGDGEVCLTAIEASMSGTFQLIVRKDLKLTMPRAESATHYIAMGLNEDLDEAARQALRQMIAWITDLSGLPAIDAYTLCSLAADLRISQVVDVNKGVHCMLPKSVLPPRS